MIGRSAIDFHTFSRRGFFGLGAGAASIVLLSACGSTESAVDDSGAGRDTVLFDHNGFTVEIPDNPQRVMCLDTRSSIEFSLLAGYPMVAVRALSEPDEGGVPNPVFARPWIRVFSNWTVVNVNSVPSRQWRTIRTSF
ncbi:ABC transporter substrate-binding protein [Rhodococcus qingshengii]|uniref:ABC transporter substrate-binding protein n=1 Tax=Rhodococcus TaxID=1827 RepID=UPI001BB0586B|nr:ABC transporter substrate-binding protein [Rhodococcus qingshengii]MBS3694107.1 ABC transporter substrate-binding protein [Rhodococcus qingshengii]